MSASSRVWKAEKKASAAEQVSLDMQKQADWQGLEQCSSVRVSQKVSGLQS